MGSLSALPSVNAEVNLLQKLSELSDQIKNQSSEIKNQGSEMKSLKQKVDLQSGKILSLEEKVDSLEKKADLQGGKILSLEKKVGLQGGKILSLEKKIDSQEKKMDENYFKLDKRLTLLDKNNRARMANSICLSTMDPLTPLASLKTGSILNLFPETIDEVENLSTACLKELLEGLEEIVPQSRDARRKAFKQAIGLQLLIHRA
ncbi:hypothetical protein O181_051143 [Austropuccinia psidii MF-1]|uniref:Uncharacterized protein n=1 Tax=Austropuccinia psidii MF-1 TaxID=1389203 RepID=A0A9Q3E0E5_9BASI|nr:hypothetical protein [Austropuccinia psidii MF-1]